MTFDIVRQFYSEIVKILWYLQTKYNKHRKPPTTAKPKIILQHNDLG